MDYEQWDKMHEQRSDARQAENDQLKALLREREAAKADKPADQQMDELETAFYSGRESREDEIDDLVEEVVDLQAEVERLQAELRACTESAMSDLALVLDARGRLLAALEPFARMYGAFPLAWGSSVEHETIYAMNDTELKYADFWRAQNALESETQS
jgi:hypothetical protein